MMKVWSIMTVDLLIFDKSSVFNCVGELVLTIIDFTVSALSLDLLVDESATHQINWPGFWGATGCPHAGGGTCTCRDRGGAVSPGPGLILWRDSHSWGEDGFSRKSTLGVHRQNHGCHFGSAGPTLISTNPIGEIGDDDEVHQGCGLMR